MAEQRQRETVKSIKKYAPLPLGDEVVCVLNSNIPIIPRGGTSATATTLALPPTLLAENDNVSLSQKPQKSQANEIVDQQEHVQPPNHFDESHTKESQQKPETVHVSHDEDENMFFVTCAKQEDAKSAIFQVAQLLSSDHFNQQKLQWDKYLKCEQVWKSLLNYLDKDEALQVDNYVTLRKADLRTNMLTTVDNICTQSLGFTNTMKRNIVKIWMNRQEANTKSALADGSFVLPKTADDVLNLKKSALNEGILCGVYLFAGIGDLSVRHFITAQTLFRHQNASSLGLGWYEPSAIGKAGFLDCYRQFLCYMSLPFVAFFVLKNNEILKDKSRNVIEELFEAIACFIDKDDYFEALRYNLNAIKSMMQRRNPKRIKTVDIESMLEHYIMDYVDFSGEWNY